MRIESITITNFCSCTNVTIPLNSFNPIIGYNNSGKSNILRAISWLLRKSVLQEHSFNDPSQSVFVEGLISDISLSILPANQQAQVARYVNQGKLNIRRRQDAPSVPAAQVRIEVRDYTTGEWVANPVGLDNALGVLFPDPLYIEAMDDAADDIGKFAAKNTIGLLLKYTVEQIHTNNAASLQTLLSDLQTLDSHLAGPKRLAELNSLETQASTEISEFFPGLGMHLDIQSPTLEELVKGATISLSDSGGHKRPFTSFGHGAQRTVQMALIKLLASQMNRRAADGATIVLLIDEPELYLHPQAIELLRDALETLSRGDFQVIFSTHSPLMLGNSHILNTSIIYRGTNDETLTRAKLSTATSVIAAHPHHASAVFSIQNSTYFLFSEKVLVVEGKTERMLLPEIYKAIANRSFSQDKTCIIEGQSSTSTRPITQILQSVGYTPKAVVDLDYIFKIAPSNGLIDATSQDFIDCKDWFTQNHTNLGFHLGPDGFPSRKGQDGTISNLNPEEAFERLALAMINQISNLCGILRSEGIWAWSKGAIESHLGIQKNDSARMAFITTMATSGDLNHATHPADLQAFVHWLQA